MEPFKTDEVKHLQQSLDIIHENIERYTKRIVEVKAENDELNDRITPRDRELNSQMFINLSISTAILDHLQNSLRKNKAAADKPYFGRIDYQEVKSGLQESLYIGKNGVAGPNDEVIVVDWRAPVATVYYENEKGRGAYEVPEGDPMEIDLVLKRTFDIENAQLNGYYDSDIAANDQLLVQYLAKNKDVVLNDIIATIQKDQDKIIRSIPFKNTIVQGVAGSGKTTVAMHRISHILYNYEKRYGAEDFCIIGSNDMLLSYITSGLPELDVRNVKHRRMDEFLREQLYEDYKKSYRLIPAQPENAWKCRMDYVKALDKYLSKVWHKLLRPHGVEDEELGEILSRDQAYEMLQFRKDWSVLRLQELLNDTLQRRIRFLTDLSQDEEEFKRFRALRKVKLQEYKNYFQPTIGHTDCLEVYRRFVSEYAAEHEIDAAEVLRQLDRGYIDVYDLAALTLVRRYMTEDMPPTTFGQIIIDEAQDFGEMIYYVLKRLQPGCYFTVMGDVSQNIHYEMGMNDWEALKKFVFNEKDDSFDLLLKSYRNTIEISEYAGRVLEKASDGAYKIEPVIRHGQPVAVYELPEKELADKAAALIEDIRSRGYQTIAVICREQAEANALKKQFLKAGVLTSEEEDFQQGLMVLPIELTKGLEFDAVILWKPDAAHYGDTPKEAKLLYVAITRALHELCLLTSEPLTPLLAE